MGAAAALAEPNYNSRRLRDDGNSLNWTKMCCILNQECDQEHYCRRPTTTSYKCGCCCCWPTSICNFPANLGGQEDQLLHLVVELLLSWYYFPDITASLILLLRSEFRLLDPSSVFNSISWIYYYRGIHTNPPFSTQKPPAPDASCIMWHRPTMFTHTRTTIYFLFFLLKSISGEFFFPGWPIFVTVQFHWKWL